MIEEKRIGQRRIIYFAKKNEKMKQKNKKNKKNKNNNNTVSANII